MAELIPIVFIAGLITLLSSTHAYTKGLREGAEDTYREKEEWKRKYIMVRRLLKTETDRSVDAQMDLVHSKLKVQELTSYIFYLRILLIKAGVTPDTIEKYLSAGDPEHSEGEGTT